MKTSNENASVKVKLNYTEECRVPFFRVYKVVGYCIKAERTMISSVFLYKEDAENFIKRNKECFSDIYNGMWVESELVFLR